MDSLDPTATASRVNGFNQFEGQQLSYLLQLQHNMLKVQSQLSELSSKLVLLECNQNELMKKFTISTANLIISDNQVTEAAFLSNTQSPQEHQVPTHEDITRLDNRMNSLDNELHLIHDQLSAIVDRTIDKQSNIEQEIGANTGNGVGHVLIYGNTNFKNEEFGESPEYPDPDLDIKHEQELVLGDLGIESLNYLDEDISINVESGEFEENSTAMSVSQVLIDASTPVSASLGPFSQLQAKSRAREETISSREIPRFVHPVVSKLGVSVPVTSKHKGDKLNTEFEDRLGNWVKFSISTKRDGKLGKLECPRCSTIYQWVSHLKYHYNSKHLDPTKSKCGICGQLVSTDVLASHQIHHLSKASPYKPKGSIYSCKACTKSFHKIEMLAEHYTNSHSYLLTSIQNSR